MPAVTVKRKSRKSKARAKVHALAQATAESLLESSGARVLVVYEPDGAVLYYDEPTHPRGRAER